jgi:hypothetical protein
MPPGWANFVVENVHGGRLLETGRTVKKKTEPASGDRTTKAWESGCGLNRRWPGWKPIPRPKVGAFARTPDQERCCHPMRSSPAVWRQRLQGNRGRVRQNAGSGKVLPSHAPKLRRLATSPTREPWTRSPERRIRKGAAIPCAQAPPSGDGAYTGTVGAFARTRDQECASSHAPKPRRLATAPTREPWTRSPERRIRKVLPSQPPKPRRLATSPTRTDATAPVQRRPTRSPS